MHAASLRAAGRAVLAAAVLALAACSGSTSGPGPQPPPACKGIDQSCGVGGECCSGDCPAGACGCSAIAERCGTSNDCCTSLGPARCDGGTCVSGQRPLGDVCDWDGLCASFNCDLTGHCAPACGQYGAACAASAQCCGYLGCPAGTCTPDCGNTYDPCTTDNQCCADYRCRAGECQAGLCGTAGQACDSEADCCTVAQGGKEFFCNAYGDCDIGQPYDWPGTEPDACVTDADCAGDYPCRGGFCHWPDGEQQDGQWCLDGQECDGGHCTSIASGVPGTCCSGAGTACSVGGYGTVCCAGLDLACTGVAGAQSCGSCLDFTNSGPQGTAETQCTSDTQCCRDQNLGCVGGECCTRRGHACTAGTGEVECCAGDTCGDVTDYQGTTTVMCCGTFGERCGYDSPCCDGLLCGYDGTCHLAPGEACTEHAQCANYSGCKIETPPEGVCCGHDMAKCDSDADCCSGNCDEAYGSCEWAQEYGPCLDDSDCGSSAWGAWDGTVCGGNASLGPHVCCPVPGDTCQSAADCCETGDACQVPYDGSSTSALCCRETPSACEDDAQCCTGMCWSHYVEGSPVGTCCAFPWLTNFTCTSNADCCDSDTYSGVYARARCGDDDGAMRCCRLSGQSAGGDPSTCCNGRDQVDQFGNCR
jgi:hypothetical protein